MALLITRTSDLGLIMRDFLLVYFIFRVNGSPKKAEKRKESGNGL